MAEAKAAEKYQTLPIKKNAPVLEDHVVVSVKRTENFVQKDDKPKNLSKDVPVLPLKQRSPKAVKKVASSLYKCPPI